MTRSLFSLDVVVVIVVVVVVVVPRYKDSHVATSNDSIPSILLVFLLRWTPSSCCRCFGWQCC